MEELQHDLDQWIAWYNTERTHSGRYCYGKTPWQTFLDSIPLALVKQLDELPWRQAAASSLDEPLAGNQKERAAKGDDAVGGPDLGYDIGHDIGLTKLRLSDQVVTITFKY